LASWKLLQLCEQSTGSLRSVGRERCSGGGQGERGVISGTVGACLLRKPLDLGWRSLLAPREANRELDGTKFDQLVDFGPLLGGGDKAGKALERLVDTAKLD
jgi:hypothetical protein